MEHTNLKQDNYETIAPRFTDDNTPYLKEQLHEESVQWFTRFVDEFAPMNGTPKYSVHDTLDLATAISARMIAYPLIALRMKDGSALPPLMEELVITTYLAKLESHLHDIIAKRDAVRDKQKEGTGI